MLTTVGGMCTDKIVQTTESMSNKNTQRAQITDTAAHYPHIARIHDLDSQHCDPDHPKNLINCSLYHCRAILKILSKSSHNLLSNGWIADWAVRMVIWIATKM